MEHPFHAIDFHDRPGLRNEQPGRAELRDMLLEAGQRVQEAARHQAREQQACKQCGEHRSREQHVGAPHRPVDRIPRQRHVDAPAGALRAEERRIGGNARSRHGLDPEPGRLAQVLAELRDGRLADKLDAVDIRPSRDEDALAIDDAADDAGRHIGIHQGRKILGQESHREHVTDAAVVGAHRHVDRDDW